MLDSHKYHEANRMQRAHALETFLEYSPKMLWRKDGQDTILDVGCAEGTVTEVVLEPLLPKDYKTIIGIDINEEFIKHAQRRNKNERISYKTMDITGDIHLDLKKFDHITSFFCLHWVNDKRRALENIYSLLAEGGDCLLTIAANYSCHKIMKIMSLMDQWKHCFEGWDFTVAPFKFEPNPVENLRTIFKDLGFKHFKIDCKPWPFDHDFFKSFNPIANRLSEEEYEKYIDDFLEITWMFENDFFKKPITRGDSITIYAQK